MAYTPELTTTACCTLRRLAWAAGLPMTKTINRLCQLLPEIFDKQFVCEACRDKSKCSICAFSDIVKQEDVPPYPVKRKKTGKKNPVKEFNLEYPPERETHSGGITEDDLLYYAQDC